MAKMGKLSSKVEVKGRPPKLNNSAYIDNPNYAKFLKADNYPSADCLGCSQFFIKNYPVNREGGMKVSFISDSKLTTIELLKAICYLLNMGGGAVIVADKFDPLERKIVQGSNIKFERA